MVYSSDARKTARGRAPLPGGLERPAADEADEGERDDEHL
jgi:hypothetical protein